MPIDSSTRQLLVEAAVQARRKAYAPYSNFAVGAATLAKPRKIINGTNL